MSPPRTLEYEASTLKARLDLHDPLAVTGALLVVVACGVYVTRQLRSATAPSRAVPASIKADSKGEFRRVPTSVSHRGAKIAPADPGEATTSQGCTGGKGGSKSCKASKGSAAGKSADSKPKAGDAVAASRSAKVKRKKRQPTYDDDVECVD